MTVSLEDGGWTSSPFTCAGITHDVYRKGRGPGVIVIHEMPGITPRVARFADDLVAETFTVFMPSLFGTPGRPRSGPYLARSLVQGCVSREFSTWAAGRTSPVISWLRALARRLHAECEGPGVGAVGMCFTGGFALAMMVDETMVAPVLSQPALPFPVGARRAADLGLSADDVDAVTQRAADGCDVLGLWYRGDRMVGTRFDTLDGLIGGRLKPIRLNSRRWSDHSVLTEQRDEGAVEQVVRFLTAKLKAGG
jgi:dienelactone hydrolase